MSPHNYSDDQLRPGLDLFLRWREVTSRTLSAFRSLLVAEAPASPQAYVWELQLAGPEEAPPTKAAIYWAREACWPTPVLLHMSVGEAAWDSEPMRAKLLRRVTDMGCAIISIQCEGPGPFERWTAVAGCHRVLHWLSQNADELGIDTNRIGVTGSWSAGTLAAAVALLAHDCGQASIAVSNIAAPSPCKDEEEDFVWTPSWWSPSSWPAPRLAPPRPLRALPLA